MAIAQNCAELQQLFLSWCPRFSSAAIQMVRTTHNETNSVSSLGNHTDQQLYL